MDVDAVEAAGRELQAKAQSIDTIVANLDKTVNSLTGVWDGKDAQTFISEWWPDHKKALAAASQSVSGLGQSALNNASEQRQASGAGGISGTAVAGLAAAGTAALAGGAAAAAAGASSGQKGSTSGSLPPASADEQAAYHQFESDSHYDASVGYNVDANGKAVDNCTAWADWRREQLGYSGTSGMGGQMAERAGGTTSTPPTLGALGSYYPSDSPVAGHVFVVEGVTSNNPPTIQISEANYAGSPIVHTRVLTQGADGNWHGDGMGSAGYQIAFSPAS
jgi:surface antigen/uncharacterized protein YukE